MAGRDNFNWTEDRQRELKYAVHNYNRRLERIKKLYPDLAENLLPERAFVSELKQNIATGYDLRRTINRLNRMTEDTVTKFSQTKDNYSYTKYDVKEKIYQFEHDEREKAKRLKRLESIEASTRGKPTGTTRGEMGSAELAAFKPSQRPNIKQMSVKEYEAFGRMLDKRSNIEYYNEQDELLRDNYIRSLFRELGVNDQTKELATDIKNMNLKTFINCFFTDQEATFSYVYDDGVMNTYKMELIRKLYKLDKESTFVSDKTYSDTEWDNLLNVITKNSKYY